MRKFILILYPQEGVASPPTESEIPSFFTAWKKLPAAEKEKSIDREPGRKRLIENVS